MTGAVGAAYVVLMPLMLFLLFAPSLAYAYTPTIRVSSSVPRCPDVLTSVPIRSYITNSSITDRTESSPRVINGNLASDSGGHLALISPPTPTIRRCTAIRIATDWALTAAHCEVTTEWTALATTTTASSGFPLGIDFVITHPQYHVDTDRRFDVALLRLIGPSGPVFALPSDPKAPVDYSFVRVSGYGIDPAGSPSSSSIILPESESGSDTHSNNNTGKSSIRQSNNGDGNHALRHADIPVVPHEKCAEAYSSSPNLGFLDAARQVCAGYPAGVCDACRGDSGGPLSQFSADGAQVAVGLVSAAAGCARPGYPGINVRLAPLLTWLRKAGAEFELAKPRQQFGADPSSSAPPAEETPTAAPTVTPSPSSSPTPSPSMSPSSIPLPTPSPSSSAPAPSLSPLPSLLPASISASPAASQVASPFPSSSESTTPSASATMSVLASVAASSSPFASSMPSADPVATLKPSPSGSAPGHQASGQTGSAGSADFTQARTGGDVRTVAGVAGAVGLALIAMGVVLAVRALQRR